MNKQNGVVKIIAWAAIRNDLNTYFNDRIKGYETI